MKKFAPVLATLLFFVAATAMAQSVDDDFSSMRGWNTGSGDWVTRGGRLVQQDEQALLARADRIVDQRGFYELEFTIRYVDGGYRNMTDFENGIYHAGFGIHLGVENPTTGRPSWGAGESYLLWLNLDTRESTMRNYPEHYGFRAQVYESLSNSEMALMRDPALARDRTLTQYVEGDYMSIDIIAALRDWGVDLRIEDIGPYLDADVPINIRVNARTGEIGVLDPTAPVRFFFTVDPEILQGTYVALRTNSLAASYDYFTVD